MLNLSVLNFVCLVEEYVGFEVKDVEVWENVLFVKKKNGKGLFVSKKLFVEKMNVWCIGGWDIYVARKGFDIKRYVLGVVKKWGFKVGGMSDKELVKVIVERSKNGVYKDLGLVIMKRKEIGFVELEVVGMEFKRLIYII